MPLPNYLKPKSIKAKANKREKIVHKHLVSGALDFFKGDFSDKTTLFDNKSTDKKSIRVTEIMLDKIIEDTATMGKENSVVILDLPNYYVVGRIFKK